MVLVNPATGLRVDAECPCDNPVRKTIALWPRAAQPWLTPYLRKLSALPPLDPVCGKTVSTASANIQIMDIQPGTVFRPQGVETRLPTVTLKALGGRGRLYWMLDGELIGQARPGEMRFYQFRRPGRYTLTVMDQAGRL